MSLEKVVNHHYFTYFSLEETIDFWDLHTKIIKNYPRWHFKNPLPRLSSDWISLIKHSLFYYFLKNLQWCLSEVQGHWIVVHSHAMKQAYSRIVISHVEDFDLKLLILIRTISFFIGEMIHQILIDSELQNDIYQLIVHNLLGITVQPYAYRALLKIYKTIPPYKHQRHSQDDDLIIDCQSLQTKTKVWNLGTRRHAKRQTIDKILQVTKNHSNLEEMRSIIKEHLYVQPIVRASTPKYNIHQLRQIDDECSYDRRLKLRQSMNQREDKQEFKRQKRAIMSNQLSNAFEFNSNLKLKDVKTFAIHRSKPRLQPICKTICAKTKNENQVKLEIKCQDNKQNKQRKHFVKGTKNWTQIVSNMKLQLYTGKHKIQRKKHRRTPNYDDEYDIAKFQSRRNIINNENNINLLANNTDTAKFRRIDMLSSQNLKILEEKMREHKNEEMAPSLTKNFSLFMDTNNDPFGICNLQQKSKAAKVFIRNTALH